MMSLRLPSIAAGALVVLALSPMAHAAPIATRDVCTTAMAAADSAENDYNAIKKDLERRIADDGHPDKSELQALQDADAKRVMTASQAQRACGLL
ncbi:MULTISPECIES: hypothetical protein [unclassified Streptomyces]|uniref:hypothetical protein n=1 Tax=unclassified Streptomyces TaxID=2593676 RepID=UPI0022578D6D|nr:MULTISPECIES: hypothetical protein [unclassified Streptomyces]MCX5443801.1 hypothetical protein [Streptomyces sp. NBC_00063]WUB90861.1 hypothetical protein OHO83_00095 [Streptomyces sp. NBC_00569]WUB99178.1 hypothetical protein OHO83_46795 [Streptomyces sp. NBC_00569]